jgi:hypothetical protein
LSALSERLTKPLKTPNYRRLFKDMDQQEPLPSSDTGSDDLLRFPVPAQPLKGHPPLTVETVVAQMEALLEAANLGPEFEAMRLAGKNAERFRI